MFLNQRRSRRVAGLEAFRDLALDRLPLRLYINGVARANPLGHGHLHQLRNEGHLATRRLRGRAGRFL